jgi:hypothetical protein
VCSIDCLQVAIRRKAFERAWRRPMAVASLDALQNAFRGVITNMEEWPITGCAPGEPAPMKG